MNALGLLNVLADLSAVMVGWDVDFSIARRDGELRINCISRRQQWHCALCIPEGVCNEEASDAVREWVRQCWDEANGHQKGGAA